MDWYILGTAAAFLGNHSQGNISTGGEDTSRFQASLQNTPQYASLPSLPQIGAAQHAGGSQVSTKLSSASMCYCVHLGGHQKCYVAVAKRCNHRLQQIIGLWPTAGWWSPRDVTIEVSVFRVCGVPQVGGLREHICEQDVCDEGWAARVAGVGV